MAKMALAPCNGMSPNGLVARVAVGDCGSECSDAISICMGSTSADIGGVNNEMLKKQPIVAINGCSNGCVNKIL
ncbi:MAG: putative zinc-binding protein, partial [Methanobrevibacter sp.]